VSVKPAHELHRLGMSVRQIKDARERSTDLNNAVWLLKHSPAWDERPPAEILEEIDGVGLY
jgi:hypothetical protein